MVKLITDKRLESLGAVIVNSAVVIEKTYNGSTYTYQAVIQPNDKLKLPADYTLTTIPGQATQLITRHSVDQYGPNMLALDCGDVIGKLLPAVSSFTESAEATNGGCSVTLEMTLTAAQAQELRGQVPSEFVTVS
jgi:hypothetical protein